MKRFSASSIPLLLALAGLAISVMLALPQIWRRNQLAASIYGFTAIIIFCISTLMVVHLILRIVAKRNGPQDKNQSSAQTACKSEEERLMFIKQHSSDFQEKNKRGYSKDDC